MVIFLCCFTSIIIYQGLIKESFYCVIPHPFFEFLILTENNLYRKREVLNMLSKRLITSVISTDCF